MAAPPWTHRQQRGYSLPEIVGDEIHSHEAEACQRARLSTPKRTDILLAWPTQGPKAAQDYRSGVRTPMSSVTAILQLVGG